MNEIMNEKKIIVYSLSTCRHCKETIHYIEQKSVEFSFIDIDLLEKQERRKVLEDIKQINPQCTFPTTVAGDAVVIGFNESELDEALNQV